MSANKWAQSLARNAEPIMMVVCTLFMLTHAESEACDSDSDHYSILDKVTWRDFVGFGCAAVGLMVAAGGGIGGGGILVPIYILVMDFSPKKAIPLSNVSCRAIAHAGGSLLRVAGHDPGGFTLEHVPEQ